MPLLGRQRGWWAGVAAAIIALLAFLFMHYRGAGTDGDSAVEGSGGRVQGSHLTRLTRGNDSSALQGDSIRAKVRSLLDVKKGEVGVIQLPPIALEEEFELVDQSVGGGPEFENGIGGLFSPEQLTPILERLLREKHRLPAKFGTADGLDWASLGLESLEVEEKGQVTDLTIRYRDSSSGKTMQTGISVFNGFGLLMKTGSSRKSAGFIIVTGSSPE